MRLFPPPAPAHSLGSAGSAPRPAWHLYSLSTGTYTDLVRINTTQNDRKALLQDIGLLFLLAGTLVLVAIPITALVTILGM
jgi:hypothetical protein